jgi:hypothetical protein
MKTAALISIIILLYWFSAITVISVKTDFQPGKGSLNLLQGLTLEYAFSPGAGTIINKNEAQINSNSIFLAIKLKNNKNLTKQKIKTGVFSIYFACSPEKEKWINEAYKICTELKKSNKNTQTLIDFNFITPDGSIKDCTGTSFSLDKNYSSETIIKKQFSYEPFINKIKKIINRNSSINFKVNLIVTDFSDSKAQELDNILKNINDCKIIFLPDTDPGNFIFDPSNEYFFPENITEYLDLVKNELSLFKNILFDKLNLTIKSFNNTDIKNIYGAKYIKDGDSKIVMINKMYKNKDINLTLEIKFKNPSKGLVSFLNIQPQSISQGQNTILKHNQWTCGYLFLDKPAKIDIPNRLWIPERAKAFQNLKTLWNEKKIDLFTKRKKINELFLKSISWKNDKETKIQPEYSKSLLTAPKDNLD